MTASRSRTFRSDNSEAVRLASEVAFGLDVELAIFPAKPPLSQLLEILAALPRSTGIEVRDHEILPERKGL